MKSYWIGSRHIEPQKKKHPFHISLLSQSDILFTSSPSDFNIKFIKLKILLKRPKYLVRLKKQLLAAFLVS